MRWIKIFASIEEAHSRINKLNPLPLQIGDKKITLVYCNESWYAVDDACPHQHASLAKGWTNHICDIICPLHEYRFDLSSGRESQGRTSDLGTYPVKLEDGLSIGIN